MHKNSSTTSASGSGNATATRRARALQSEIRVLQVTDVSLGGSSNNRVAVGFKLIYETASQATTARTNELAPLVASSTSTSASASGAQQGAITSTTAAEVAATAALTTFRTALMSSMGAYAASKGDNSLSRKIEIRVSTVHCVRRSKHRF